MKSLFVLFVFAILLGCQNLNTQAQQNTKIETEMDDKFKIGDCLLFKGNDDMYYGLILFGIDMTVEDTTYSFLQSGKKFKSIPDYDKFLNSGILGNKIPSGSSPNPVIGFNGIYMINTAFEKITSQIVKVGEIALEEAPISLSEGGYSSNAEDLSFTLKHSLQRLGVKNSNFPYPKEIFPISLLRPKNPNYTPKMPHQFWILSKKTAHPKAIELLNEDYYWNQADEYAPFGNDDGFDALHLFQQWRTTNANENPVQFVEVLARRWEYEIDYLKESNAEKIAGFFDDTFKQSFDNAIISICFGQLVLEGKIDDDLKELGIAAIQRQLHENVCNQWASSKERIEKLNKELVILNKNFK